MGKRKSRVKIMKPAPPKVSTVFDCPFCSHNGTVEVRISKPKRLGTLSCRVCHLEWQNGITSNFHSLIAGLTKPVDIYCEWLDACNDANTKTVKDPQAHLGHIDASDDEEHKVGV